MDHRRRTTRRTALFADTLEDDSSYPLLPLSSFPYRRPPFLSSARPYDSLAALLEPRFRFKRNGYPRPLGRGSSDYAEYQRRISWVLSAGQGRAVRPRELGASRRQIDIIPSFFRYGCVCYPRFIFSFFAPFFLLSLRHGGRDGHSGSDL